MQKANSIKKNGLLFISAMVSLLSGRVFQLPFLLILFQVFAILYLRRTKILKGFMFLFAGSASAILIAFWGIAPHMFSSTAIFIIVMAVSTFVGLLPILLDALLYKKRVNQLWLIAAYPCSKVLLEYLGSVNSPFGVWGSQASLLACWQPFNNIVAYGGIWALSLIVALFSSILVYLFENRFRNKSYSWSLAAGYLFIGALVMIAGSMRIKSFQPTTTVSVAVVLANDSLRTSPVDKIYRHLKNQKQVALSPGEAVYFQHAFELSNEEVLQQTQKAAAAGAKFIFCGEGNVVVLKDNEKELVEAEKKIALKYGVYLGLAAEVYTPNAAKPVENKIIFLQPDGTIGFEYFKHFPIGIEKDLMVTGDGTIPACYTPYGKVAAVICFDTDFITYARKAGAAGVDILFAPSNDWESIAELRGKINRYRALENGFTFVRPTSHGVTEMVAPTGKLICENNYFRRPSRLMFADIPARRMPTMYVQAGDWLPVLMLVILVALTFGFWRSTVTKSTVTAGAITILLFTTILPVLAQAQAANTYSTHNHQDQQVKKSKTILLPVLSYAPETGIALGISAIQFYKTSASNKLSQITGNAIFTFNRQFINEASLLHYTPGDDYLVKAGLSFNKFPEKFYGIGNKTTVESAATITYSVVKMNLSLLKKIQRDVYAGVHYNYANYYHIFQDNSSSRLLDTLTGGSGSVQSGVGVELLHDSRDHASNSTKGWYALFDATWNNSNFGSGTDYFALDADIRKYHTLNSGAVLALQGLVKIKEGEVPFTQLSYLGGGNMMRGFYSGRFRDKDLVAVQVEYRRHLWRNWGFVLFAGAGKVSTALHRLSDEDLQRSIGFGFRRSISKQSKVNLRVDIGYANGQYNFYLNLGEAF